MEEITLRITDLARGGAGVSRDSAGRVIFVPYSAPGDLVKARIKSPKRKEKRYAQAELVEIIEPSQIRQSPKCPAFGKCGGCNWQHIPYELQWKTKVSGIKCALERVGIGSLTSVIDELPAAQIWNYRNRVQLRGAQNGLGFYAAGSHELVPVDHCSIAREEINAEWKSLREEGLRQRSPFKVEVEVLENGFVRKHWNRSHAAGGFRQIHDEQNKKLKEWVNGHISRNQQERGLLDLYGGSGNLSLGIERMSEVHCVDLSAPSSEQNHERYYFHRSKILPWLLRNAPALNEKKWAWSAILDPPREGIGEDFQDIVACFEKLGVSEVILVGCDPDSWSRDLFRFTRRGWNIAKIGAVDLFPQTPHVESMALLWGPSSPLTR